MKGIRILSIGVIVLAVFALIFRACVIKIQPGQAGVLNKEWGLRSGSTMSHVFIWESKSFKRLIFVTDGAMNIAPDLVTKGSIIMNAVHLARMFGLEEPRVAVLAAVEMINPSMPATLDATCLAKMHDRNQ